MAADARTLAWFLRLAGPAVLGAPLIVGSLAGVGCGARAQLLDVGDPIPKLSATAHDGETVNLGELSGPTVVYFYPKDDTPGCTKEACAFRDIWSEYEAAGVLVVGVSTDDAASHRAFADKHGLPFPLIADTEEKWAKSFGVASRAGFLERVSFLLGADGKIVKVYPDVDPGVHAREILADANAI